MKAMDRQEKSRRRSAQCVAAGLLALGLAACSSSSKLLESPSLMPGQGGGSPSTNLTLPPSDALAKAEPSAAGFNGGADEELGPGAAPPTPEELAPLPQEGIDAPKTAQSLQTDIDLAQVAPSTRWRGKITPEGVDIANVDGTLCSGLPTRVTGTGAIVLACSDGRMGELRVAPPGGPSRVMFEGASEGVELKP